MGRADCALCFSASFDFIEEDPEVGEFYGVVACYFLEFLGASFAGGDAVGDAAEEGVVELQRLVVFLSCHRYRLDVVGGEIQTRNALSNSC